MYILDRSTLSRDDVNGFINSASFLCELFRQVRPANSPNEPFKVLVNPVLEYIEMLLQDGDSEPSVVEGARQVIYNYHTSNFWISDSCPLAYIDYRLTQSDSEVYSTIDMWIIYLSNAA